MSSANSKNLFKAMKRTLAQRRIYDPLTYLWWKVFVKIVYGQMSLTTFANLIKKVIAVSYGPKYSFATAIEGTIKYLHVFILKRHQICPN